MNTELNRFLYSIESHLTAILQCAFQFADWVRVVSLASFDSSVSMSESYAALYALVFALVFQNNISIHARPSLPPLHQL